MQDRQNMPSCQTHPNDYYFIQFHIYIKQRMLSKCESLTETLILFTACASFVFGMCMCVS